MEYEQLKILNNSLKSRNYFNRTWYIKHIEIIRVEGNTVYGNLYTQHQKNKKKYEEKTVVTCSLEELVRGLKNKNYYINNLSKIKSLLN